MSKEIEQKYIDYYKQMAGYYRGISLAPHISDITKLVKETSSKTLLDFGCGSGKQYTVNKQHEAWGIMPSLYDPAIKEYSVHPTGPFDGVISTDVFEHIPEEALQYAFEYIFAVARKFVFLNISTMEAYAKLPNGENAHCTIKPIEWWAEEISKYNKEKILVHLKTNGHSTGYYVINHKKRD